MAHVPALDNPQKFLCGSLESALKLGILTAADLVEHYGVASLVTAITDAGHRAEVLAACSGLDPNTGRILPVETTGMLLDTAVKAGRTNPDQIKDAITISGLVYYQPPASTWRLLIKKDWPVRQSASDRELMAEMLKLVRDLHLLDNADEGRNTYHEIVMEVSVLALVKQLPPEIVAEAWQLAMVKGESGDGYTAVDALGVVTPEIMAERLELRDLVRPLHAVARKYKWDAVSAAEPTEETATSELLDPPPPPPGDDASLDDEAEIELVPAPPSGVAANPLFAGNQSSPEPAASSRPMFPPQAGQSDVPTGKEALRAMSAGRDDLDSVFSGLESQSPPPPAATPAHRPPPPPPPRRGGSRG